MSEKIFSCTGYGEPITVYSPDDMHLSAARNKKDLMKDDIVEIPYKCKKCGVINITYWGFHKLPNGVII